MAKRKTKRQTRSKLGRVQRDKERLQQQYQNLSKLKQIQEKISLIPEIGIQLKSEQLEKARKERELNQLQQAFYAMDEEIQELSKIYCKKSGKLIFQFPIETITDSIEIHGIEKTKWWLKQQRNSFYHPVALFTCPKDLRNLFNNDIESYVIMGINILFEECFKVDDLIEARRELEQRPVETVIHCGELLRRFLGLCNPKNRPGIYNNYPSLYGICASNVSLENFIKELKQMIHSLVEKHCSLKQNELLNLAATLRGYQNYRDQDAIKDQKIIDIMFQDFDNIFFDDREERDEMLAGLQFQGGLDFDDRPLKLDSDPTVPFHLREQKPTLKSVRIMDKDTRTTEEKEPHKDLFKGLFK